MNSLWSEPERSNESAVHGSDSLKLHLLPNKRASPLFCQGGWLCRSGQRKIQNHQLDVKMPENRNTTAVVSWWWKPPMDKMDCEIAPGELQVETDH